MTGSSHNARAQALYREVNERIAAVCRRFGESALEIICECGLHACVERISLAAHEYERIRSRPTHFAVVHGHENAAAEDVVWVRDAYLVVANHGAPASVARPADVGAASR